MANRGRSTGQITLADVASASGFSVSTVSIVLNEAPLARSISAKTKERIREAALRLGYRPDAFARSLRSRRSHLIGIMVFDIADPFCTPILKGIQQTLQPTTYLPIIMDAHNDTDQFERYLGMLLERRVEGLIVVANWLFVDIERLASVERERIPTIMVGQQMRSGSMSSIMVDNETGGYLALQHLHSLGHREIAVVRGPAQLPDTKKRWNGMQRFASEAGLKLHRNCIVDLPEALEPIAGFHEGLRVTSELLSRGRKFTGVVAFDDMTAIGVMSALRATSKCVPEDYSVVGFDDVPAALFAVPPLTTIRQPMEQMGTMAAERLLTDMDEFQQGRNPVAKHWLTEPELVVRESTKVR